MIKTKCLKHQNETTMTSAIIIINSNLLIKVKSIKEGTRGVSFGLHRFMFLSAQEIISHRQIFIKVDYFYRFRNYNNIYFWDHTRFYLCTLYIVLRRPRQAFTSFHIIHFNETKLKLKLKLNFKCFFFVNCFSFITLFFNLCVYNNGMT